MKGNADLLDMRSDGLKPQPVFVSLAMLITATNRPPHRNLTLKIPPKERPPQYEFPPLVGPGS